MNYTHHIFSQQNGNTLSVSQVCGYLYKKEADTFTHHYHYIYGDNGVVALHLATQTGEDTIGGETGGDTEDGGKVSQGVITTDSLYYIHTDHLGSYCAITNATKEVRQRNWFDPWGNYSKIYASIGMDGGISTELDDSDALTQEDPPINFTLTNRGFTGHEHYPYFKIINMNGRLYDPVIGRFFSPDKYVANSSFTQDFNRYSYARNNPLMYTGSLSNIYSEPSWVVFRDTRWEKQLELPVGKCSVLLWVVQV